MWNRLILSLALNSKGDIDLEKSRQYSESTKAAFPVSFLPRKFGKQLLYIPKLQNRLSQSSAFLGNLDTSSHQAQLLYKRKISKSVQEDPVCSNCGNKDEVHSKRTLGKEPENETVKRMSSHRQLDLAVEQHH